MKLLRSFLVALLCLAPAVSLAFWQSRDSGYNVSVGGAPPATTTLNPADKAGTIALSAGNLVMTGGIGSARSISNYSTGKFYYEVVFGNAAVGAYNYATGLANVSASLTAGPGSPDTNSTAYYNGDPVVYSGGASAGNTGVTPAIGDRIGVAVDIGGALIWVRVNGGNWNGNVLNNPVTGVGGFAISIATPWYALGYGGNAASVNTYNFGATAYTDTPPVGYGNF